jgi:hypothetical protein
MLLNQLTNPLAVNIIIVSLFVWLLFLSFFLLRTVSHYRRLIFKSKKKDLRSILEKILEQVKQQGEQIEVLKRKSDTLEKGVGSCLQKIGFARFNPFSDTGGDQSFCLSLLDDDDSGIILSSLHSRGQTRVYAKEVKKGEGKDFALSKEEEGTIKKAKKGR